MTVQEEVKRASAIRNVCGVSDIGVVVVRMLDRVCYVLLVLIVVRSALSVSCQKYTCSEK